MKIRFWGVRGSYPTPGEEFMRYGGNTSCVSITADDGTLLIFDGGTGIRDLGKELVKREFGEGKGKAYVFISHTHWDHIQGFPFFEPSYRQGNEFVIHSRQRDDKTLRSIFAGQYDKFYYPVPMEALQAKLSFKEIKEGDSFKINENIKVSVCRLNHPYIALGYRIEGFGKIINYITDTAPFDRILMEMEFLQNPDEIELTPKIQAKLKQLHADLIKNLSGSDLVIYDTFFKMKEYEQFPHWGHSTPEHAYSDCKEAGASHLVLFHHHTSRNDEAMDEFCKHYTEKFDDIKVTCSQEGMEISV